MSDPKASGLARLLEQIRKQPRSQLISRYLALISDMEPESERVTEALRLADVLTSKKPLEAMRIAHMVHQSHPTDLRAFDAIIASLTVRGRYAKAEILRHERDKVAQMNQAELEGASRARGSMPKDLAKGALISSEDDDGDDHNDHDAALDVSLVPPPLIPDTRGDGSFSDEFSRIAELSLAEDGSVPAPQNLGQVGQRFMLNDPQSQIAKTPNVPKPPQAHQVQPSQPKRFAVTLPTPPVNEPEPQLAPPPPGLFGPASNFAPESVSSTVVQRSPLDAQPTPVAMTPPPAEMFSGPTAIGPAATSETTPAGTSKDADAFALAEAALAEFRQKEQQREALLIAQQIPALDRSLASAPNERVLPFRAQQLRNEISEIEHPTIALFDDLASGPEAQPRSHRHGSKSKDRPKKSKRSSRDENLDASEFSSELREKIQADLEAKLEAKLKSELQSEFKDELKAELQAELTAQLGSQLESHLRVSDLKVQPDVSAFWDSLIATLLAWQQSFHGKQALGEAVTAQALRRALTPWERQQQVTASPDHLMTRDQLQQLVKIMAELSAGLEAQRHIALHLALFQLVWGENCGGIKVLVNEVTPEPAAWAYIEAMQLSHIDPLFWGIYLDRLLVSGQARQLLREVRQTLRAKPTLAWARSGFPRLQQAWEQCGLAGFQWREEEGLPVLQQALDYRRPPTLRALLLQGPRQ